VGYKHVHEKPVALNEIDSRVPLGLAEVVMRCLEKAPDDRYSRGTALADALLKFLAHGEDAVPNHRAAAIARRQTSPDRA
jgi:serine/threonine-protein kinase